MKIAVISDIHGNLDAFREVLADIDRSNVDAIISLGDNIGYGPEPEGVVRLIRKRKIPSVMGNHELVVADRRHLEWFNPIARKSLQKTISMLSNDSINFICGMKPYILCKKYRFVHGFPPDSPTTYLFHVSEEKLQEVFEQMKEEICFIGHTHELEIIGFDRRAISHPDEKAITRTPMHKGITFLYDEKKYIINVGSVGQPRDGDNNSKYVIWDTLNYHIEVKYIPYDIATVVNKIFKAGLPKAHANRLW
ncbi:metallophosphoesterase family protein [Desulfonema magnum]|uniref:Metallophosphoesterase n=1 Tax=Desulfonema magnum TaxID=45655 RepID=A0A975GLY8_9BACT|nr:metallophosphoesterase family protein [Desulfonema magnum]QTA86129.1 Metallophosphoesterase [Desulfonema magnum]